MNEPRFYQPKHLSPSHILEDALREAGVPRPVRERWRAEMAFALIFEAEETMRVLGDVAPEEGCAECAERTAAAKASRQTLGSWLALWSFPTGIAALYAVGLWGAWGLAGFALTGAMLLMSAVCEKEHS